MDGQAGTKETSDSQILNEKNTLHERQVYNLNCAYIFANYIQLLYSSLGVKVLFYWGLREDVISIVFFFNKFGDYMKMLFL